MTTTTRYLRNLAADSGFPSISGVESQRRFHTSLGSTVHITGLVSGGIAFGVQLGHPTEDRVFPAGSWGAQYRWHPGTSGGNTERARLRVSVRASNGDLITQFVNQLSSFVSSLTTFTYDWEFDDIPLPANAWLIADIYNASATPSNGELHYNNIGYLEHPDPVAVATGNVTIEPSARTVSGLVLPPGVEAEREREVIAVTAHAGAQVRPPSIHVQTPTATVSVPKVSAEARVFAPSVRTGLRPSPVVVHARALVPSVRTAQPRVRSTTAMRGGIREVTLTGRAKVDG